MHCPAPRVTFQAGPTRSSSSTTTAAGRLQTTARGCCSRRRKTSDAQRDTRWCTAGSMASSCAAPLGWVILSIYLFSYLILSLSLKYLYLISWAGRAPLIHHPSCGCVHSPCVCCRRARHPLARLLRLVLRRSSLLRGGPSLFSSLWKAPLLSLLFSTIKGRPLSSLFSSLFSTKGRPLSSLFSSLLRGGPSLFSSLWKAPLLSLLFSTKGRPFSLLFSLEGPSPLSSLLSSLLSRGRPLSSLFSSLLY